MKKKIIITVLFIVSIVALVLIGCIIEAFKPVRHGIPISSRDVLLPTGHTFGMIRTAG